MGDNDSWEFGGLILGGILFVSGIKSLKLERLIRNTPTSKIRSLAMGLVEIKGIVVPVNNQQILKSPFSNKDCVYYYYTVEENHRDKHGDNWSTIKKETKFVNFRLQDDTGEVLVNPDKARMQIPSDNRYELKKMQIIPETVAAFLTANNIKEKGWFGFRRELRCTEYFIEPGNELYVLGNAGKNPSLSSAITNQDTVIIQKGSLFSKVFKKNIFFISDQKEETLLKELKASILLCLWGGGGLIALATLSLLFRMGAFK